MSEKPKLIWLQSHPIQYFSPLYRALAEREDIDIEVVYCSRRGLETYYDREFGQELRWNTDLVGGYRHSFLWNMSPRPSVSAGFFGLLNPGVVPLLWRNRGAIVVVQGWRHATMWLAAFAAKLLGCKVCMRGDSSASLEKLKSPTQRRIKDVLLRRLLFPMVDCFLCIGKENRDFYSNYGAPAERLSIVPFSVDTERFEPLDPADRERARAELGLNHDTVYGLFLGKLYPRKRPLDLVEAYRKVAAPGRGLVFIGAGIDSARIEEAARTVGDGDVRLLGFVNQSELPRYIGAADFLILPSETDPWGLSVNEAMACGLPVLVSSGAGCSADLVDDGTNGYVFPPGDLEALSRAMERVYADPAFRQSAGRRSLEIISAYSIRSVVERLCAVIRNLTV